MRPRLRRVWSRVPHAAAVGVADATRRVRAEAPVPSRLSAAQLNTGVTVSECLGVVNHDAGFHALQAGLSGVWWQCRDGPPHRSINTRGSFGRLASGCALPAGEGGRPGWRRAHRLAGRPPSRRRVGERRRPCGAAVGCSSARRSCFARGVRGVPGREATLAWRAVSSRTCRCADGRGGPDARGCLCAPETRWVRRARRPPGRVTRARSVAAFGRTASGSSSHSSGERRAPEADGRASGRPAVPMGGLTVRPACSRRRARRLR